MIPSSVENLTAGWLTEALRSSGVISSTRVTAVTPKRMGSSAGWSGELARLHLTYDARETDAPTTLMLKLSSPNPDRRAQSSALNMYQREVWFYQEIADQIALRTPRCYYSDMDSATGEHILLLEDLAPFQSGGERFGVCSPNEAKLAVKQIAVFHAFWWENPRLAEMENLWRRTPTTIQFLSTAYQQRWESFWAKAGRVLPNELQDIGQRLGTHFVKFLEAINRTPQTMVHGDFHLGNLIFHTSGTGNLSMTALDWQLVGLGPGTQDLAMLLCMNFEPIDRKAQEESLLRLYHTTLVENGVKNYSFEQCWDAYRLLVLNLLGRLVFLIGGGGNSKVEDEMFFKIDLPYCVAAILELKSGDLLPA